MTIKQRHALLILGMHRSGTSALGGVLARLGAQAPRSLMAPTSDNPRGYFESVELMKLHDQLLRSAGSRWNDWGQFAPDWIESHVAEDFQAQLQAVLEREFGASRLFLVKDPRVSRFLPFWLKTLAAMGIEPRIVIPVRHPLEVARSLEARDYFGRAKSLLLWLRHMLDAEAASRGLCRSFVRYDDLMLDWKGQARRIASDLSIRWPRLSGDTEADIGQFLSTELRHHVAASEAIPEAGGALRWAADVHAALERLVDSRGEDSAQYATLDRIKAEFDRSSIVYAPVVREHELRVEGLYAGIKAQLTERNAELMAAREEQQQARDQAEGATRELQLAQQARQGLEAGLDALRARVDAAEAKLGAALEAKAKRDVELAELEEVHAGAAEAWETKLAKRDEELANERKERAQEAAQWAARLAEQDAAHAKERDQAHLEREELDSLRSNLAATRTELAETKASLQDRFGEIAQLTRMVFDLEQAMADKTLALADTARELAETSDARRAESEAAERSLAVTEYALTLARDAHARTLRAMDSLRERASGQERLLEHISSSRFWRFTAPFHARLQPVAGDAEEGDSDLAHQFHLLHHSELFDPAWYLDKYPEARDSGLHPITHYLRHGAAAGLNPGPGFDTAAYLVRFPDLRHSTMNPLAHYIAHGREEGRAIQTASDA